MRTNFVVVLEPFRHFLKSFGGSSSTKGSSQSATTQRSSVTSGADLSIVSNKDGLVVGSTIRAKEALSVDVKGDLTIASAQDTFSKQESRSKSSGFNLGVASYNSAKSSTSSVSTVTNVSSELSGKNVNLTTSANLNVQASDVIADQDITLDVGGDLNVVVGADVTETQSQRQKSSGWSVNIPVYMVDISAGKTSGKSQADSVYNEKAVASNITAGNDLTIDVGNDAHINGSNLTAGNDANVTLGGDLSVTTSQDVHQESHETSKFSSVSGGVGYAGYNVNVSKGKSKGAKTTERDIVNQGSSFKAGNNLNLKADNLAMSSGKLEADQDIQLITTGDTTFTTAVDVHETSSARPKEPLQALGRAMAPKLQVAKPMARLV